MCERLKPDIVSKTSFLPKNEICFTNDIATARALCLSTNSWALLPQYVIQEGFKAKELKILEDISFDYEKFGIWLLRERNTITPIYDSAIEWLKNNPYLLNY